MTGSRINALTAHAQILLSCLKQTVLDRLRVRLNVILYVTAFSKGWLHRKLGSWSVLDAENKKALFWASGQQHRTQFGPRSI